MNDCEFTNSKFVWFSYSHNKMPHFDILFLILIMLVAFLYSSVGHGGASGYLALMVLFNFSPEVMKPSALLLNIFVSGIAFYQYYRSGFFQWKIFLPFVLLSVPLSFIGASIELQTVWYKIILGICLIIASLRLLGFLGKENESEKKELPIFIALLIGGMIGLISGMIGIGGGILLSPILILFHWAKMKETAAISALFILVNSASGLFGAIYSGATFTNEIFVWLAAAIAGGSLGAYYGSKKFNNVVLKYLLSAVLLFASSKLF